MRSHQQSSQVFSWLLLHHSGVRQKTSSSVEAFLIPTHELSTLDTAVLCSITPFRFSFPQTLVPVCNNQSCIYLDAYWPASFNRMQPVLSWGNMSCFFMSPSSGFRRMTAVGGGPTSVLCYFEECKCGNNWNVCLREKCHETYPEFFV